LLAGIEEYNRNVNNINENQVLAGTYKGSGYSDYNTSHNSIYPSYGVYDKKQRDILGG